MGLRRSAAAGAGAVFAVPAVVGVAAVGRVVGRQLDLAARCLADAALAEGADRNVGTDGSPAGGLCAVMEELFRNQGEANATPPGQARTGRLRNGDG